MSNDAPHPDSQVESELYAQMRAVMQTLDEYFNEGRLTKEIGIVVLTFKYGSATGRCNYMSNGASRKDMASLFREMAARMEGGAEMPAPKKGGKPN
jgi:hypothetical protein